MKYILHNRGNTQFNRDRILFLMFFISGFCSLLYQVVWLRLAYAYFGVITPVMSLVISVFMLGLAVGSWIGGRWISELKRKSGKSAIYFYAVTEVLIGVGAIAVTRLFSFGAVALLSAGDMDSIDYLAASAVVIILSILPWCILMGMTFPFMMSFIREVSETNEESFSFLYLANVAGATTGTLVTAYVLVEVLGFHSTLLFGAASNFLIAVLSIFLGKRYPFNVSIADKSSDDRGPILSPLAKKEAFFVLAVLFTTGFTSMSMEVVWVRAFTPVFGTNIYSFASLLAVYLLATSAGSHLYRKHLKNGTVAETSTIITTLAEVSLLPILLNDPKLLWHGIPAVLLSIFPICACLGYLTPKLIDQYSEGAPRGAGEAYAINITGCILGPVFASYFLLPLVGVKISLIVLAIPYVFIIGYFMIGNRVRLERYFVAGLLTVTFFILSVYFSDSYEEYYKKNLNNSVVRRDYAATVVSFAAQGQKGLRVNGIGITSLTQATKNMAHLPLSFLARKPKAALVICFGMGTTYRSLLSWGIEVTAVELVPSVRDAFNYYFSDAESILRNPKGRIVVDDGRRFLNRTGSKYDVITIDPPPPPEAAGSSLLYSEEFYESAKKHLKKGGILQQWFPAREGSTLSAVARSLINSFPYVKAFKSVDDLGVHFIASSSPLETPTAEEMILRLPDSARRDLTEWYAGKDIRTVARLILLREIDVRSVLSEDRTIAITDDEPFNEYFFLRKLKIQMKNIY
jgi:spermidine synthase